MAGRWGDIVGKLESFLNKPGIPPASNQQQIPGGQPGTAASLNQVSQPSSLGQMVGAINAALQGTTTGQRVRDAGQFQGPTPSGGFLADEKAAKAKEDRADMLRGALGNVGGMFQSKGKDTSVGQIGSGVFGAAGKVGDAAGMPWVAAAGKFGETLFSATDKLREWTTHLQNANFQFAEFSGAMSRVQAEAEVRRIHREQLRGARRSESADYLARSRDSLEDKAAPIEDAWANIKNYISGFFTNLVADFFVGPLSKIVEFLSPDTKDPKVDLTEYIEQAKQHWERERQRNDRPQRFR